MASYLNARPHSLFAMGIDGVPSLDCWALGYPRFQGMGLVRGEAPGLSATAKPKPSEPYIFHFPDGNASIARLLVRGLVPRAAPGSTMEDIVTARMDYGQLDEKDSPVRIRLSSTAVRVKHRGDPESEFEVGVVYVCNGRPERVRASHVVMGCWNSLVPYLCPEIPKEQRDALSYGPKVPLVYTNVFIRNWTSFHRLGVSNVYCPSGYHSGVSLDFPVSLGEYRFSRGPEEPMVLHLTRTPWGPPLSAGRGASRDRAKALRPDPHRELRRPGVRLYQRHHRSSLPCGFGDLLEASDERRLVSQRWLLRHARFHLHFTPKGTCWINQVERFFADLTNKQLRSGVRRSSVELERAIRQYIDVETAIPTFRRDQNCR